MNKDREALSLLRLKALAIGALLVLHLTISFTWIPGLFGIWPVAVKAPSMNLTGFAALLNMFGLVLFFILSGFLLRHKADQYPTYLLQKSKQNLGRFLGYYILLSILFYLLLTLSKGRLLGVKELDFLNSFYHLWFLVALAAFQFIFWVGQKLIGFSVLKFKIPVFIPIVTHAICLYLQGGIFLKTPTQIDSYTLLSLVVYFVWFCFGLSINSVLDLTSNLKLKTWVAPITLLVFYFLSKAALIFSWPYAAWWQIFGSLIDPLVFFAVLVIWFKIESRYFKKALDPSQISYWQDLLQRHQLRIYVFQIPLIFVWIALLEKCGVSVQNETLIAGLKPNWNEALATWLLFNLTLWIFGFGAWRWLKKQKTPAPKDTGV